MILLGFAFLSGLVTILAPCIWPLLPIILSSTFVGKKGHAKPLGITLGIMLSFAIFTLSISTLVRIFHFDPNVLRIGGVIVIAFFGLTMIVPFLSKQFEVIVSRLSSSLPLTPHSNGFWGGFITGLSLGIIWSPCAGPILASIAALAATGHVTLMVVFVTLAYVTGVGIPLFFFAYAGQNYISSSRKLSPYTNTIQQAFGFVMILVALLIYSNKIQDFQLALVDRFPVLDNVFNGFEKSDTVKTQLQNLKGNDLSLSFTPQTTNADLFNANAQAPDFAGVTKWLNTDKPLTLADLKGKVVLVDFWTYTCINCIRTLPHVTHWYDTYHNQGFVVVGVHTPEFAFEKETANVKDAIKRFTIHYPVAQDNDYATWNAYSNEYWPAEYLIDAKGTVRRVHFGEGEYDQMEKAIQTLLSENGQSVSDQIQEMPDTTPKQEISPETYVGSKRMQYYASSGRVDNGTQTFTQLLQPYKSSFVFSGTWTVTDEYSQAGENAKLDYNFSAGKVFLVLKPGNTTNGRVAVFLDGKLIPKEDAGNDVVNGFVTVDGDRLYNLVQLPTVENHILELQFQNGIQAFAFTFGD